MFGFNNAEPIDIEEVTKKLMEKCPGLLMEDEKIDLAFKAIRDSFFFTTHRILFKDRHGITGKRTEYKSCPYHCIKAFGVETAGGFDSDSEMFVYSGSLDMSINFDKKKVNIYDIQKYLSSHVFVDSFEDLLAYNEANPQQTFTEDEGGRGAKLLDYLAGDSVKLDEAIVENEMHSIGALVPNERIKLAYKCGRDMVICTTKRMLYIDTKGISGKRIEYLSMRYSCIKGYEVETAGNFFDRDAEFKIFTNIDQAHRCIKTELRKGQCDVMEVLWYFNNKILGMDTMTLEEALPLATDSGAGGFAQEMMTFFTDDMCQIDATVADQVFHSNPPILQASENCEIAFQGRRDLVLFTTKRILFVDKQGWSGKKMAYTSFPYSSIKIFNAATAGTFDKDGEFGFYTEIWYDPPKCNGCEDGCGDEQPTPGMSYLEFDINKHTTDMLGLYRYVAAKVHRYNGLGDLEIPRSEMVQPSPQGAVQNLLNFLGQDMVELDPAQIEASLSMGSESPILINDEKVLMAFKCGRDKAIFTSKAILYIDRKGITGKKTEFQNIPYSTILNFATASSGSFDRDSELTLTFATPWFGNLSGTMRQDFASGNADIIAIQNLIAAKCLGPPGRPSDFANDDTIKPSGDPGSMKSLIAFITDKHLEVNPQAIEQKFKVEIPVLQEDEAVELAFKHGRDMFIITTKRIMAVDVQGLSGKKVEFRSVPYKFMRGFSVETASTLGRSVEATFYCSKMAGGMNSSFDKETNIFEINNSIANKTLNHATHQI